MGRVPRWAWEKLERGWESIGRRFAGIAAWADVIGLVLVAATGALALAHSAEFPNEEDWSKGHPLPLVQVGAGILLVLTQVVLVVKGRKGQRNRELEAACRQVAAYIDEHCPNLPLREVGVHIWTVAGPPCAKHLRRSGSFLLSGDRARSGIRWTKGKGVVGSAWAKRIRVVRDLDEIAKVHWSPSEETEMTPDKRAKAEEQSLRGSGPRIVDPDLLRRLEREEAPKFLIKAARHAIKTNPV